MFCLVDAVNEFDREILTKSPGFSHSNTMMDEEIVQSNEPVAVDNRPLIVRIGDKVLYITLVYTINTKLFNDFEIVELEN